MKMRADDLGPYSMSYSKYFEQHKIMFEKKISVVARCCWKYNCLEWSRWNLYTSQKIFYYTHKAYMWFTLVSYQQSPKVWATKYNLTNLSWYNLLTISKLAGFVFLTSKKLNLICIWLYQIYLQRFIFICSKCKKS